MSKIISHNSWSYLPTKQLLLKPLSFIAKCQEDDILVQLETVDGLDLRIRFDKYNRPVIAHGLIEYELNDIFNMIKLVDMTSYTRINKMNVEQDKINIRVLLETLPTMSKKERKRQKELFSVFCSELVALNPNIVFWGGWPRDEWCKKVYDFGTKEPEVTEMHGSVSGNKLNCLSLKNWAETHNHEILTNCKTEYAMIDFICFK